MGRNHVTEDAPVRAARGNRFELPGFDRTASRRAIVIELLVIELLVIELLGTSHYP